MRNLLFVQIFGRTNDDVCVCIYVHGERVPRQNGKIVGRASRNDKRVFLACLLLSWVYF